MSSAANLAASASVCWNTASFIRAAATPRTKRMNMAWCFAASIGRVAGVTFAPFLRSQAANDPSPVRTEFAMGLISMSVSSPMRRPLTDFAREAGSLRTQPGASSSRGPATARRNGSRSRALRVIGPSTERSGMERAGVSEWPRVGTMPKLGLCA